MTQIRFAEAFALTLRGVDMRAVCGISSSFVYRIGEVGWLGGGLRSQKRSQNLIQRLFGKTAQVGRNEAAFSIEHYRERQAAGPVAKLSGYFDRVEPGHDQGVIDAVCCGKLPHFVSGINADTDNLYPLR